MFLFATTFYPLSVYPRPIQLVVECLPLYHAMALTREPVLGTLGSGAVIAMVGARNDRHASALTAARC